MATVAWSRSRRRPPDVDNDVASIEVSGGIGMGAVRPYPRCIRWWAVRHARRPVELVGIVSSVSADITHNGVVPMASLLELLEHQADYLHVPAQELAAVTTVHVTRS